MLLVWMKCNYILFTKLPWPGDRKGPFRLPNQAATCLDLRIHDEGFARFLLMLNVKQGSCEYQFLWSLAYPDWKSNPSLPFQ